MDYHQDREQTRSALLALGYTRVNATKADARNNYCEHWKKGKNRIVISWDSGLPDPESVVDTTSKGFLDGVQTGLNWTDNYIPGGPWHYPPDPRKEERENELARETQRNYRDWMAGFHQGLKENPNPPKIK